MENTHLPCEAIANIVGHNLFLRDASHLDFSFIILLYFHDGILPECQTNGLKVDELPGSIKRVYLHAVLLQPVHIYRLRSRCVI